MPFLIYEKDPFVRNDIYETLEAEFADQTIVIVETFDGLQDMAMTLAAPTVAVLAVSGEAVERALAQLEQVLTSIKCVIIGDDPVDHALREEKIVFLQRPFSSGTLVESVRSALSRLSDETA